MKKTFKYLLTLMLATTFFSSCDTPDLDESLVKLDGPIQEVQLKGGALEFNGSILNTANVSVKSVYVLIVLYDSEGTVIDSKSVLVEENPDLVLQPYETNFFTIIFEEVDPNNIYSKEVEIYYDPIN